MLCMQTAGAQQTRYCKNQFSSLVILTALPFSLSDSLYLVILPDEGTDEHKLPFPQATCPLPSRSANVCHQSHEGDAPEEPQEDGVDKTEQCE